MLLPSLKKGQEVRGGAQRNPPNQMATKTSSICSFKTGGMLLPPLPTRRNGTKNRGRRPPSRQNPRPKTRALATKRPGRPNRVARGGK